MFKLVHILWDNMIIGTFYEMSNHLSNMLNFLALGLILSLVFNSSLQLKYPHCYLSNIQFHQSGMDLRQNSLQSSDSIDDVHSVHLLFLKLVFCSFIDYRSWNSIFFWAKALIHVIIPKLNYSNTTVTRKQKSRLISRIIKMYIMRDSWYRNWRDIRICNLDMRNGYPTA